MLYRPEDFEPVTEEWDEGGVRAAVARIVADVDEAYRRQPLWPPPADSPVASGRPEPSLHAGAPGVVWALDALARRGHAESKLDLPAVAVAALEAWRASPVVFPELDDLPQRESSLLAGQAGILLVAWLLTGEPRLADDLHELVRANVDADEIDELMWGTGGHSSRRPRSEIAPAKSAGATRAGTARRPCSRDATRTVCGHSGASRTRATSGRCMGSSATSGRS